MKQLRSAVRTTANIMMVIKTSIRVNPPCLDVLASAVLFLNNLCAAIFPLLSHDAFFHSVEGCLRVGKNRRPFKFIPL